MIEYLEIRDGSTLKLIGVVDAAKSIIWECEYYGAGSFEIYAVLTEINLSLLQVGNFVTKPNDPQAAIIETIDYTESVQDGAMIIASGRMAKSVLDRRIVYNLTGNANAPTIISGNVATAVQGVVNNHAGSGAAAARNMGIVLGSTGGITKTITTADGDATRRQTSYGGLLEFTDSVLQEYACGAYIGINENLQLEYNCYEGQDRSTGNTAGNTPVIFSQDFDNLVGTEYQYDTTTEKNCALVGGEGEGMERFCVEIIGENLTPWTRRETFIDASSQSRQYTDDSGTEQEYTAEEYAALLTSQGRAELAEMEITETFTGEISTALSPYKFGQNADYWLGDIVTVQDNKINMYAAVRVLKSTEVQDENGYLLSIEYGNE